MKTYFIDDQFIPSNRSLGSNKFTTVSQWLRIRDISPSSDQDRHLPWTVVSSPKPSDIEQGALGNCWLLAALAVISEQPRILRQILLTQTISDDVFISFVFVIMVYGRRSLLTIVFPVHSINN